MKRLKILILCRGVPYLSYYGNRSTLLNVIKNIYKLHDLTFLMLIRDEDKRYVSYMSQYGSVETVEHRRNSTNIARIKYFFSISPYGAHYDYNKEFKRKFDEITKKADFDIIHADLLTIAQYIPGSCPIPKVAFAHDCLSLAYYRRMKKEINLLNKIYLWLQWHKYTRYEKIVYGRFNAVIVVSESDRLALKKIIPHVLITVAPIGVDFDYYKRDPDIKREKSMIFTGVMDYYPNISSAMYIYERIYPRVKKVIYDLKFYIVGMNPVKKILNLQKIDKDVIVTGFVEDMRPFFAKGGVFVCYMIEGAGMKNKILQAMSMEAPVVANNLAMVAIEAVSGRDFMLANSAAETAERIISLLENPALADEISKNAKKNVVSRYTWANTAKIVNRVYGEIIAHEKYPDY